MGQGSFRNSFFHHLFIPPKPTGSRNFKVRCLILALSFATVFFHVRTHSTRVIFLAVIKLLETHQYSHPHSCISFLLNVTGQTTISPFVKDPNKIKQTTWVFIIKSNLLKWRTAVQLPIYIYIVQFDGDSNSVKSS